MGTVGIAALLAAKALGVTKIIAVDIVDGKLELAASLGASNTINTKHNPDVSEAIRKHVPRGADFILDATGIPSVIQASLGALAHGGTFALVGAMPPGTQLQVDALDILTGCKKILGVIEAWSDPQEVWPSDALYVFDSGCLLSLVHSPTCAVVQGWKVSR